MLKIRRPLGRLIFNMGIAIPGKTVFLIETAPCKCLDDQEQKPKLCKALAHGGHFYTTGLVMIKGNY